MTCCGLLAADPLPLRCAYREPHTGNGSEFRDAFDGALHELQIAGYFSRVHTPTDNPVYERFNRTLDEKFIQMGNMTADCAVFNRKLTAWLVEYNFHRPHQALGYVVPVEYHHKYQKVSPMYPSKYSY